MQRETMVGKSAYGEGAVRISVADPGGSSKIFKKTLATFQCIVSAPSRINTRRRPIG
jgi:hypothetical protein